MFEIKNGNIYITRCEKAELTVDIYSDVEGGGREPYTLGDGEKLRLRVLSYPQYEAIAEKFTEEKENTFQIEGKDTEKLSGQMAYSIAVIYPDGSEAFIIAPSGTDIPRLYVLEG